MRGIVPALLGPSTWASGLPSWIPSTVAESRQVVLFVLDGLGWDQLNQHRHVAPTIAGMSGGRISTVAPTTTATALTSISTGLTPGEHGLIGYRMLLGGEVINVLRWAVDGKDRRKSQPPADIQRYPAFLGDSVPMVSPADLLGSAFTEAHLRGGRSSSSSRGSSAQLLAGVSSPPPLKSPTFTTRSPPFGHAARASERRTVAPSGRADRFMARARRARSRKRERRWRGYHRSRSSLPTRPRRRNRCRPAP